MTTDVKLLPLPEPDHVGGNDVFGKEFPLFTAEQAESYARANMEPLLAENERLRAEVERLNKVLGPVSAEAIEMRHEAVAQKRRAERLAEALRFARERFARHMDDSDRAAFDAALDQEGGNG